MSVRAKFRVTSIEPRFGTVINKVNDKPVYEAGTIYEITLSPVIANTPENAAFFAATPAGSIVLQTIRQNAADQFEIGAQYYVDFTRAD